MGPGNERRRNSTSPIARCGRRYLSVDHLSVNDIKSPIIRRQVGLLRNELFGLEADRAKAKQAIASIEKEIEELDRNAKAHPRDVYTWELLDANHELLANLYRKVKDSAKSFEQRKKAVAACQSGLAVDPALFRLRNHLLLQLAYVGDHIMYADPAAALKLFEESLAHQPLFPADLAVTSQLRTRFGMLQAHAGDCLEMLNKPADALKRYEKALEHHTKVAAIEAQERGVPVIIAYDHRRMGELRLYQLDFKGAVADYQKASDIIQEVRQAKDPRRPIDIETAIVAGDTEKLVKLNLPYVKSLPKGIETLEAAVKQPAAVRLDALSTARRVAHEGR